MICCLVKMVSCSPLRDFGFHRVCATVISRFCHLPPLSGKALHINLFCPRLVGSIGQPSSVSGDRAGDRPLASVCSKTSGFLACSPTPSLFKGTGPQIEKGFRPPYRERHLLSVRGEGPRETGRSCPSPRVNGCGLPAPSERITAMPSFFALNTMYRPSGVHTAFSALPLNVKRVIVSRGQS